MADAVRGRLAMMTFSGLIAGSYAPPLAVGAAGALWLIFCPDLSVLMQFKVGRGKMIYFCGCAVHALYCPLARVLDRGTRRWSFPLATRGCGGDPVGSRRAGSGGDRLGGDAGSAGAGWCCADRLGAGAFVKKRRIAHSYGTNSADLR